MERGREKESEWYGAACDVEPCAARGALRLVTSAAAEASSAAVVDGSCWRVAVDVDDSAWPAARAAAAGAAGARSVAAAHAAQEHTHLLLTLVPHAD